MTEQDKWEREVEKRQREFALALLTQLEKTKSQNLRQIIRKKIRALTGGID